MAGVAGPTNVTTTAAGVCEMCRRPLHWSFGALWDDRGRWDCPAGAPESNHVAGDGSDSDPAWDYQTMRTPESGGSDHAVSADEIDALGHAVTRCGLCGADHEVIGTFGGVKVVTCEQVREFGPHVMGVLVPRDGGKETR